MKKRILSLFFAAIFLAMSFTVASAELTGDCNKDGKVDITDLYVLLSSLTKRSVKQAYYNLDGNDTIDIRDVMVLLHLLEPSQKHITLVANGYSKYSICADDALFDIANALSASVSDAYGVSIPVTSEDTFPCIKLAVGDTSLGKHGYSFAIEENSLIINASDAQALTYALGMFKTNCIDNQVKTDFLCFADDAVLPRESDAPFTLSDALAAKLSITLQHEELFSYGRKTIGEQKFTTAQGACTDGKSFYFIIRMKDDSACIIVKTDLTGNELAVSEPLDLGHGNDMTYDSKYDRLVVVHGTSTKNTSNGNENGRRLSFVDPETLTVLYTQANIIPANYVAGAVAYAENDDVYYFSAGASVYSIATISEDFVMTYLRNPGRKSRDTEGSSAYTSQGMGTDGKYIYFPMSLKDTDNILVIYDMNAKYITTLHIPTAMESESLFFIDGELYMFYNHKGAVMGKAPFTAKFE